MNSGTQVIGDLFSGDALAKPDVTPANASARPKRTLKLTLDNRGWLEFLSVGWWTGGRQCVRMGIDDPLHLAAEGNRIRVIAAIEAAKLGSFEAAVWGESGWSIRTLGDLAPTDREVVWPAPIPLSAVEAFFVESVADKDRLLAMTKGFANVDAPTQPILVQEFHGMAAQAAEAPALRKVTPPSAWDTMRGAAAMAVWAVPRMVPWVKLIDGALSGAIDGTLLSCTQAPWLAQMPWSTTSSANICEGTSQALWQAALEVFRGYPAHDVWRPTELLEEICLSAEAKGAEPKVLRDFRRETSELLRGERQVSLGKEDSLTALAIQLVLLRPAPDQFASWKDESEAIAPAVWLSGATLCGLLAGFKALPGAFRGSPLVQDYVARRVWWLNAGQDIALRHWLADAPLQVEVTTEHAKLISGGKLYAEYKLSRRGRWHELDLEDKDNEIVATRIARRLCPMALRRSVEIIDESLVFCGEGAIQLDRIQSRINVDGRLVFDLPRNAKATTTLDKEHFRNWILVGKVPDLLPAPPSRPREMPLSSNDIDVQRPRANPVPGVPGLSKVPDFISEADERYLLARVDAAAWLEDLSRRVQHYGWRYDYKARTVNRKAYLGPLPQWLSSLAERLWRLGLVAEMPDQVIVNEYIGKQGIAKHIDCPSCFRGPIVTISLCEAWEMLFRGPAGEKEGVVLDRRSAVVIDGPARTLWNHEIPKRLRERGQLRGRRVSLTFRKVNAN